MEKETNEQEKAMQYEPMLCTVFNLTDKQIESVANLFSTREAVLLSSTDLDTEWLLNHAFQLGMKHYRDLINGA